MTIRWMLTYCLNFFYACINSWQVTNKFSLKDVTGKSQFDTDVKSQILGSGSNQYFFPHHIRIWNDIFKKANMKIRK